MAESLVNLPGLKMAMLLIFSTCLLIAIVIQSSLHLTLTTRWDLQGKKVILFWTKFFDREMLHRHDDLTKCNISTCVLTDNRAYVAQSSAIIFHAEDLDIHDLPRHRTVDQLYVFFLLESPCNTFHDLTEDPWKDFFNLTFTYRLDSDIFCPTYSDVFNPGLWSTRKKDRELLNERKDRAMALISHCITDNRRELYIAELQKHYPVDIYGKCGKPACPHKVPGCVETVAASYKFYLSFENSHCKDYVTEKAFLPLNYGIVPIVYGAANYSAFLPKRSFINTADHPSPRALALHLKQISTNVSLYEKFFDWRYNGDSNTSRRLTDQSNTPMCQLCQIVHNSTFQKRIPNIHQWWVTKGNCVAPWINAV